jgi:haloacetate dehalogenase
LHLFHRANVAAAPAEAPRFGIDRVVYFRRVAFFERFAIERIDGGAGATLRVRHGGDGPPVVLLHGHPRTHATWHAVAARLAPHHHVVCPDLRGYGESEQVEPYTKRAMANDVVGVMRALGHERFAVVGHDRGAYVATRLGLDHPGAAERMVILEAMPGLERLERTDWRFAASWWHWWFFGQLDKPAERLINSDPDEWYRISPELMGADAYADLRRALHDPGVVHAMLEDYRAGLREDREDDEAARAAGQKIICPLLVVRLLQDDPDLDYGVDLVDIWRAWATDIQGAEIDSGHHVAEEKPIELAQLLLGFLGDEAAGQGLEPQLPDPEAGRV